MEIKENFNDQIKPYLKQNENVIWASKPKKTFIYLPSDLFSVLMGILWLLIAVFWFVFAYIGLKEGVDKTSITYIVLSVPFALVGVWLIVGKNILFAYKRKSILYSITNKRVLVINIKKEYCEEYLFTDIGSANISKGKDGIISIYFFKDKQSTKKFSTSGIFGIEEPSENALKFIQDKVRKSR